MLYDIFLFVIVLTSSSSYQPKDVYCWTKATPKGLHNDQSCANLIQQFPVILTRLPVASQEPFCPSGHRFYEYYPPTAGVAVTAASRCEHFYRKDYTYVNQFDGFYKLHWDLAGQSWSSAFLACDDEGSTLFYPKTADEWTVVKGLVASMKTKPNVTEIFVGIHDEFGLGEFMTVDGLSTPSPLPDKDHELEGQSTCVTMEIDTGAYKLDSCETDSVKPFVCKKVEEVKPSCPTIDRDYTYDAQTKKCYKVNQRKKSWTDAMQTCFMEGGVLAVITNSVEADVVFQKLQEYGEEYFVGFRRLFPHGDYYTVKGQQFDNTFYKRWSNDNNNENDTPNDCGSVLKRNDYRDQNLFTGTRNCFQPAPFLCEMMPKV